MRISNFKFVLFYMYSFDLSVAQVIFPINLTKVEVGGYILKVKSGFFEYEFDYVTLVY